MPISDLPYDAAIARYAEIVAAHPGIDLKGKANPYTAMNGNMFSFLDKAGVLCLRLPKADRDQFMAHHKTAPVEQYGAVMKEYVAVPEALAADPDQVAALFAQSVAYAETLKPKKTTRK